MAAVTTPEHVEAPTAPVAEKAPIVEVRKVAIDNNLLSVLAVGVGLFALAFGAFTHLRERTDSLDAKIDKVATELRAEIKDVNVKIDKLSAELRTENREINARLDRLFELIASQGRRDTQ